MNVAGETRKRLSMRSTDFPQLSNQAITKFCQKPDVKIILKTLRRHPKQLIKKCRLTSNSLLTCPRIYLRNIPEVSLKLDMEQKSSYYTKSGKIHKTIRDSKNISILTTQGGKSPGLKIARYIKHIKYIDICFGRGSYLKFSRTLNSESLEESIHLAISASRFFGNDLIRLSTSYLDEILKRFRSAQNNTKIYITISGFELSEGLGFLNKLFTIICSLKSFSSFVIDFAIDKCNSQALVLLRKLINSIEFFYIKHNTNFNADDQLAHLMKKEQKILKLSIGESKPLLGIQELIADSPCLKTFYVNCTNPLSSMMQMFKGFNFPKSLKSICLKLNSKIYLNNACNLSLLISHLISILTEIDYLDDVTIITSDSINNYTKDLVDLHELLCRKKLKKYTLCIIDDSISVLGLASISQVHIAILKPEISKNIAFIGDLLNAMIQSEVTSFFIELLANLQIFDIPVLYPLLNKTNFLMVENSKKYCKDSDKTIAESLGMSNNVLRLLMDKENSIPDLSKIVSQCHSLSTLYVKDACYAMEILSSYAFASNIQQIFLMHSEEQSSYKEYIIIPLLYKLTLALKDMESLKALHLGGQISLNDELMETVKNLHQLDWIKTIQTYAATYSLSHTHNQITFIEDLAQMRNLENLKLSLVLNAKPVLENIQNLIEATFKNLNSLELTLCLCCYEISGLSQEKIKFMCFILNALLRLSKIRFLTVLFENVHFSSTDLSITQLQKLKTLQIKVYPTSIEILKKERHLSMSYSVGSAETAQDQNLIYNIGENLDRKSNLSLDKLEDETSPQRKTTIKSHISESPNPNSSVQTIASTFLARERKKKLDKARGLQMIPSGVESTSEIQDKCPMNQRKTPFIQDSIEQNK